MVCPKCGGDALEQVWKSRIKLDRCRRCRGIWFDEGELALFNNTELDIPDIRKVLDKGETTRFTCPRCPEMKLIEFPFRDVPFPIVEIERKMVKVDWCLSCLGCWLDDGELEKIEKLADQKLLNSDLSGLLAALR